jgi:hypothetical protein
MRGKTPPTEPLTSNERRRLLIVGGVCAVAVAVALTVWQLAGHASNYDKSSNGCVNAMVPSSTGGGLEHACGDQARTWCDSVYQQHDTVSMAVQRQCALAGLQRRQ